MSQAGTERAMGGVPGPAWRRAAAEWGLVVVAGLFMGAIGPFGTDALPALERLAYWLLCIVGGGVIGIAIDTLLERRVPAAWPRAALASVLMTPAVTLLVMAVGRLLLDQRIGVQHFAGLSWQVLVVSAAVMAARTLARRRPTVVVERQTVVETRTVVAPPLPEAEAAFRRRLSAKRRGARLIAVEAHDHYLRVHTDAGSELLTLRFADALEELAGAHGLRIHRSWWVAGDAIEAVDWRRGAGDARLSGGVTAPVSRTYAGAVRAAGWF